MQLEQAKSNLSPRTHQGGFTFIEVLVAMTIFTMAALAAVTITQGAVRATREARTISVATWLLQSVMVDLETKIETEGIDRGCEKKKEGKFEGEFAKFRYVTYCTEIDFKISESASKLAQAEQEGKDAEQSSSENMILKMILDTASTYISKSMREIHSEVLWEEGKQTRKIEATTHIARYDLPVSLGGGGVGAAPPAGAGTGTGTPAPDGRAP